MVKFQGVWDQNLEKSDNKLITYLYYFYEGKCNSVWGARHIHTTDTSTHTQPLLSSPAVCPQQREPSAPPQNQILLIERDDSQVGWEPCELLMAYVKLPSDRHNKRV